MKTFTYNDMQFGVAKVGNAWEITRGSALVATGLFGAVESETAEAKAVALVKTIYPVGVTVVGPDVNRPIVVGDIKYFPPAVSSPNFVYWNADSSSQPKW